MAAKHPTLSDLLRESHVAPALVDRLARTVFNMGARFPTVFSTTILASVGAAGTEVAICQTPQLTLPFDSAAVFLWWHILTTVGTGTTAASVIVRRPAGVSGTVVLNDTPITVTAGAQKDFTGLYVDTAPGAAAPTYSVNVAGTGTTGAWNSLAAALIAVAL